MGGCLLNAPAPLIIKENAFHTNCETWLGLCECISHQLRDLVRFVGTYVTIIGTILQ